MKYPSICLSKKTKEIRLSGKPRTVRTWINGAGGKLRARILLPAVRTGEKCHMAIIMHGIMTTKDIYPQPVLAKMLQERGIASICFDFNGHGASYGRFQDMTVLNEKEDALKVIEYAESLPFVDRIALCGHSQGGVVAALCAGELTNKISALLLLAPAAVCRDDALKGNIMGAVFNPSDPPDILKVMMHRLGGSYIRTAQKLDIYGEASGYRGPMCVIHGMQDRTVPVEYGRRFKESCPQCILHLLPEEGHILNRDKASVCGYAVSFLCDALRQE